MEKVVVTLVASSLLAAGVLLFSNEMPQKVIEPSFPVKETISFSELALSPATTAFNTGLEQLPASLQGTDVDGDLRVDDNGNLIISHDIRRVFDYFLSTMGAESLEQIEQRLRAYIRHRLPAKAALQAEQLLEGYLALNRGLSALQAPVDAGDGIVLETQSLRERLMSIQALRRHYLPADVVDVFFADDDALDQLALGRMDIMEDSALSADQRTQALADLEHSLPPHLQRVMSELNKHQQLNTLTARLRDSGGSDADLYQLRERFYGAEAADRLAQLDQSRQQWQARTMRWLSERDSLIAAENIDEADRQDQIDRLRREYFESHEINRVRILERLHDQEP